ncbi:MAG: hypothetical protein JXL82_00760 [Candidatus Omnitrophica bacterium]|nr:hypothetical protein [Candidatus Omnitrophota bacterium]
MLLMILPAGSLSVQLKNGKQKMVYLFIGRNYPAKDIALKRLKEEFLPPHLEDFNLDALYADKLSLKDLQEKLLSIPVKSLRRIVLVRNADELHKSTDDFIIEWARRESKNIVLALDITEESKKAQFIRNIARYAKIIRFKEETPPNTFNLSRQIEKRQPGFALKTLNQLIKAGERPERILGGLRYSLEANTMNSAGLRLRLKLLLNCDIEIKTGKLKPVFALEKLVVNLCALT